MDIDSLEQELRKELEKFEYIFQDEVKTESEIEPRRKLSQTLSQFAIAQAEGEKEQLEDEISVLYSKGEEKDRLLADAQGIILELSARNDRLEKENKMLTPRYASESNPPSHLVGVGIDDVAVAETHARAALVQLESVLSETRQQFAAVQRELESATIHKAKLEKELALEHHRRVTAEKERDAYAAAYETSLKHFEAWNLKKQQLKGQASNIHSNSSSNMSPRS